MLSFFPRNVLDEIWDLILSKFLRVFIPTPDERKKYEPEIMITTTSGFRLAPDSSKKSTSGSKTHDGKCRANVQQDSGGAE